MPCNRKSWRTQPQVGRLLANLEDEVGFTLFHRSKKRLSLTPDGWSFYRQVERQLASQESLQKLAGRLKAQQNHHVRVLTAPHLSNAIVNDALAIMAQRSEQFSASIDSRVRLDIETWVGQENFDLGVTVLPLDNPLLEVEPFISVSVMAAMHADNPLASKSVVTAEDLSGASLIAASTLDYPAVPKRVDCRARHAAADPLRNYQRRTGLPTGGTSAGGGHLGSFHCHV